MPLSGKSWELGRRVGWHTICKSGNDSRNGGWNSFGAVLGGFFSTRALAYLPESANSHAIKTLQIHLPHASTIEAMQAHDFDLKLSTSPPGAGKSHDRLHTTPPNLVGYLVMHDYASRLVMTCACTWCRRGLRTGSL